jgi:phytoene dehydrogenase-like protein
MQEYDVVIIGAGHNGLVCAAYLLKAGYSVLLLEKRSVPGGAATTKNAYQKKRLDLSLICVPLTMNLYTWGQLLRN